MADGTGDERPRQYVVVTMTTTYGSLAEARDQAADLMAAHIARSRELHSAGVLVMAGAFLDDGAGPVQTMAVFTSAQDAEAYVREDPFVRAGRVSEWTVRPWANMLA